MSKSTISTFQLFEGNYIFDSPHDPGYLSTCQAGNGHANKEIGHGLENPNGNEAHLQ